MLKQLVIQNMAIVERLELEFQQGFTVITGETGAGKSIMMEALHLLCGARADSQRISPEQEKALVTASFHVQLESTRQWLQEQDLLDTDDSHSLIIQRSITRDGRSRAKINGHPCTAQQLRQLGPKLLNYQSQQAPQKFHSTAETLAYVDAYHGQTDALTETKEAYETLRKRQKEHQELKNEWHKASIERDLLEYQAAELEELAPMHDELAQLESERLTLENAEQNLLGAQRALTLGANINDYQSTSNARDLLIQIQQALSEMQDTSEQLSNANDIVAQSLTLIDEMTNELELYINQFEMNPERLQWIQQRLDSWYTLARKHKCTPEALPERLESIQNALAHIDNQPEQIKQLETQIQLCHTLFEKAAARLTQIRKQAARQIEQQVRIILPELDLPKVLFELKITSTSHEGETGLDQATIWVRTNPGQPSRPLAEIASGGEMARLFLALEAANAAHNITSTLIFDEVDIGVGGATAERMGRLLRKISHQAQVLCITHQPQVAALGQQHLFVSKRTLNQSGVKTVSEARYLNPTQRVNELARMLGGVRETNTTLMHAESLLALDATA